MTDRYLSPSKIRRRRVEKLAKAKAPTAIRTHQQVAAIMTARGYPMNMQRAQQIECQALYKLFTRLADFADLE